MKSLNDTKNNADVGNTEDLENLLNDFDRTLNPNADQNNIRSNDARPEDKKHKNPNWRKENENLSCYALSKYSNEPEDDFDYFDLAESLSQVQKNIRGFKRSKNLNIDLSKIKLNYLYKNWKEVCEDLRISYTRTGGNTVEQKRIVLENTKYEKKGNSYIFYEIVDLGVVQNLEKNIEVTRVNCVEAILSNVFSSVNNQPIALTAKCWFELLGLVDENYSPYNKENKRRLMATVEKDIQEYEMTVEDGSPVISSAVKTSTDFFYTNTQARFKEALFNAFDSLQRRGAIIVDTVVGGFPLTKEQVETIKGAVEKDPDVSIYDLNIRPKRQMMSLGSLNTKYLECEEETLKDLKMNRADLKILRKNPGLAKKYYGRLGIKTALKIGMIYISRFFIVYPYSDNCKKVFKTQSQDKDVRAYVKYLMQKGIFESAKNKMLKADGKGDFGTDKFLVANSYLIEKLIKENRENSEEMLKFGMINAQRFEKNISDVLYIDDVNDGGEEE